ncbi:argininosuccinate synthase-related protein [Streptomyces sp. bgisy027]|uniref:argininosuccinate synthase-related protein n=1 Tax=Streptomyces sp. bgisy027 TaxID=3413770 RepID=UPI003D758C7B
MYGQLIRSFRDLTDHGFDLRRPVVTLFSGGLDSSYLLLRLVQAGASDVHAVSIDLGGDETSEEKARIAGKIGVRFHHVDARSEFAELYVRPAIAAHGVYLDTHPVSSTLSRPLIAKTVMEVAEGIGATAVLHTANRSQNSLRRINGALGLLGFRGSYGSPYDLDPVDRGQKMHELKAAGVDEMATRAVSSDSNLWCREFESGLLDDPEAHAVPEEFYRWSCLRDATASDHVEITFDAGTPVAVDGEKLKLEALIETLNTRAGAFGLGRYSGLEHLADGSKVLEIREMPAARLLLASRRHLETAVLEAETLREKIGVEQVWVREALEGRWFGELRLACQAFVDTCLKKVSGIVGWRLSAGRAETTSIIGEHPCYLRDREAWERRSIAAELR